MQKHLLLWPIPAIYVMWLIVICIYGVNIPVLDQWSMPGKQIESFFENRLDFTTLYEQHNESRMVFPNLIFVFLTYMLKTWNVKAEMLVGLGFAFLMSLFIYLLLLLTNSSFYKNISLLIVYNLCLLSPSSFSRWLRGITIHRLIPDACIIINALVFRLNINAKLKVLLFSISCVIAQFSFSGGIIVWPVTLLFVISINKITLVEKLKLVFVFIALFIISSSLYFTNYTYPPYHSAPSSILNYSFKDITIYIFSFCGNIFGYSPESSMIVGFVLITAFTGLLIVNLKRTREQKLIPWIGLGLYTIALGVIDTITRLPMSSNNALRVDYITHLAYLPLSILVIFLYTIKYNKNIILKWIALTLTGAILTFYLMKNSPNKIILGLQEWQHTYSYGKSCIQLVSFYEKDDCIKILFPVLEVVTKRFSKLSELNILQPGIVKELKFSSQGEWGYIDSIKKEPINEYFKINGWAKILERPADAIVLAFTSENQGLTIVGVLPTGETRTDVSHLYGFRYLNTGWSGSVYLKNNFNISNIKAYGFDANTNILYPLKGPISF